MTVADVMSVTGPIEPDRLGKVLIHEHVVISYSGDHLDPSDRWDRAACIEGSIERMKQLMDHGVRTFVDPCPIDLGRDPELLAEVAERSGMQIVCSTGFYHEHNAIGIPYYWRVRSSEEISEFYLHEINDGIGGGGIRPGVIKIASGDPPGDNDRKVLHGAAIAAKESGLPIVSHCENSRGGDVQQEILAEHGVDLGRCVIGHQDQEKEVSNLRAIADRGSFIGIDRIGHNTLAPEEQRIDNIAALIHDGYSRSLCLSQDHMCCLRSAKFPYLVREEIRPAFERLLPTIYDHMYRRPHTYLFTDFLPRLYERGVDEATVDSILTDNTRRLLTGG